VTFSKAFLIFSASCAFALGWTATGRAVNTIVQDDFETDAHPTGSRTVATGGTNGMQYWTHNATGANYSLTLGSDATFGSNALISSDTTTASVGNEFVGLLPTALTLSSPSDFITFSFSFHLTNEATATTSSAGFRFGIESSNGTAITADGQGSTLDNDTGYYVQVGVGSAGAPGSGNMFYNESGGTAPDFGGIDRAAINTSSGSGFAITDNLTHTASMTVTRTSSTQVQLSLTIDGSTISSSASSTNIRTTFDEIGFGDGFVANPAGFAIDNVVVTSSVPEPSSTGLFLVGLGALAGRYRRRR